MKEDKILIFPFMSFHLRKLYFDCIDPEGNCFILYQARLKFSFLNLAYSGLIYSGAGEKTIERSSFTKTSIPSGIKSLGLHFPWLDIKARAENADSTLSLLLYEDNRGSINWSCHHPKTRARIEYKGKIYHGLGYAETLDLGIRPWKLPIDELRWGRFLSDKDSIIWIHWKGSYPLNQLFCNGELFEDAVFGEDRVSFDQGRAKVVFHKPEVIRRGKLSNILATVPWLKIIFSSRILNTVEHKYKSRSSFTRNNETVNGWALFETVIWKK